MVGSTVGSYRVLRRLGEGGMGVVYEVEHAMLGNRAALKVLQPELSGNAELVRRFFNEARAATLIKHPGITKIFDFGQTPDGSVYFVMEMLEGEPLSSRLKRLGRLPLEDAADITCDVAAVLQAAHTAGIVHRDLKPDNVFLCPDPERGERVKVLDFGIAKLSSEQHALSLHTKTGAVMGTPYYMSPEQCRGAAEADFRADVYSLGCMLFEMVAGRPPFQGNTTGEVMGAHLHVAAPSVRSMRGELPGGLEKLLTRMLSKDPAQRPDGMSVVAQQLGAMVKPRAQRKRVTAPDPAPPQLVRSIDTTLSGSAAQSFARGGRSRAAWVAVGALLLAGAGATIFFITRGGKSKPAAAGEPSPTVSPSASPSPSGSPPASPSPTATVDKTPENRWVRVDPPTQPVLLGVARKSPDRGFRPERRVTAPSAPFEIQAHEVTWKELTPFAAGSSVKMTKGATSAADEPVTGVPWQLAYDYCRSLGATLPTEAQWEWAARGAERRPYPWGAEPIDVTRVVVFAGADAKLQRAGASDLDVTPSRIHDLLGNAREWTADLWREDAPGQDESWVQTPAESFRAVRGLPPAGERPNRLPAEGAAHRDSVCASGTCMDLAGDILRWVGFRCVRVAE